MSDECPLPKPQVEENTKQDADDELSIWICAWIVWGGILFAFGGWFLIGIIFTIWLIIKIFQKILRLFSPPANHQ